MRLRSLPCLRVISRGGNARATFETQVRRGVCDPNPVEGPALGARGVGCGCARGSSGGFGRYESVWRIWRDFQSLERAHRMRVFSLGHFLLTPIKLGLRVVCGAKINNIN